MFAGHKHTEATKQRMSRDRAGEKNSNFGNHWHHTPDMKYKYDGENNPMYGKKHSDETKQKISSSCSGKVYMTNGEKDIKVLPNEIELYNLLGYRRGRTFSKGKK